MARAVRGGLVRAAHGLSSFTAQRLSLRLTVRGSGAPLLAHILQTRSQAAPYMKDSGQRARLRLREPPFGTPRVTCDTLDVSARTASYHGGSGLELSGGGGFE